MRVKNDTTIQPTVMTAGPPVANPYEKRVVIPVMTLYSNILVVIASSPRPSYNDREGDAEVVH